MGAFGPRIAPARALRAVVEATTPSTNIDTIPIEMFQQVKSVMRAKGISQRAMAARRGTAYGGSAHFAFAPSRALMSEYGALLDSPELVDLAQSDLFWDRVVDVRRADRLAPPDLQADRGSHHPADRQAGEDPGRGRAGHHVGADHRQALR